MSTPPNRPPLKQYGYKSLYSSDSKYQPLPDRYVYPARYVSRTLKPEVFPQQEPEDERGLSGQFSAGAIQALAQGNPMMFGESLEALGVVTGSDLLEVWGTRLSDYAKGINVVEPPITREEADGLWEHLEATAGSFGSAMGSTALPIATGLAGAAIGTALFPGGGTLAGFGVGTIGGLLGASTSGAPLNVGEAYQQFKAEGIDKETAAWTAVGLALPLTALDAGGLTKIGRETLTGSVKRDALKYVAQQIKKGVGTEALTEGLQSLLREGVAAGLTRNPDALQRGLRVFDEALAGGLVGGTIAGAGATGRVALERHRGGPPDDGGARRPGTVEESKGGVAPLSEADRSSPLPDDLIQRGRETIASTEAKTEANQALSEFELPGVDSEAVYQSGELEARVKVVDFVPADQDAPAQVVIEDANGVTTDLQLPLDSSESLTAVPTVEEKGELADLGRFGEQIEETVRGREEILAEELIREDVENLEALPRDRRSQFLSTLQRRIQESQKTLDQQQQQEGRAQQDERQSQADRQREADDRVLFERERAEALDQANTLLSEEQVAAAEQEALESMGAELEGLTPDRRKHFLKILNLNLKSAARTAQAEQAQQAEQQQEGREREADDRALIDREYTEALDQARNLLSEEQVAAVESQRTDLLGQALSPERQTHFLKVINRNLKTLIGTAQAEQAEQPTAPIPFESIEPAEALTSTGTSHPVEYAIVEADSLVPSHDKTGEPNPNYPQFLQPRDRSRAASVLQIQKLARDLKPELLDRSPKAEDGSPIVDPAGIVESGNARAIAIQSAYEEGNAQEYRQYLESKGYPVSGLEKPVVVRIRRDPLSEAERSQFAREANVQSVQRMSRTEQAFSDAESLDEAALSQFRGRQVRSTENAPFVRAFIQKAIPETEQATFADSRAKLTAEGVQRIEAALLAKSYGDRGLVEKLSESVDPGRITLRNALVATAPRWAAMRERAKSGTLHKDVDQTRALIAALDLMERSQETRTPLAALLGQKSLFPDLSKTQQDISRGFLSLFHEGPDFKKLKSQAEIEDAFRKYLDAAARYDPRQKTLEGALEQPDIPRMLGVQEEARPAAWKEGYGSENQVTSRAQALSALRFLQENLKEGPSPALNSRILAEGATLGHFHREAGRVRRGIEEAILADLGETARPFLRSWVALAEIPVERPAQKAKETEREEQPTAPIPPTPPETTPKPTPPTVPEKGVPEWGSENKIVTLERSKELEKIIRASLNKLHVGVDPELLVAGVEMSVFHFEAGARKFSDYAGRMIESFGERVRPYLKHWYRGIRSWPGLDTSGMSTDREIETWEQEQQAPTTPTRKAPRKTKETTERISRLQDAGERLEGKRKRKAKELDEGKDQEAADEADRILDLTSKAAVWPIVLPEGATPGTELFLSQVRESFHPFHKALQHVQRDLMPRRFATTRRKGTKVLFREAVISKKLNMDQIRDEAANYISILETIQEAVEGSTNVTEASRALLKLFLKDPDLKLPDGAYAKDRSDFGEKAFPYFAFNSWQNPQIFREMAAKIVRRDETQTVKKAKPMRRPTYKFDAEQGPNREGLPDYRKGENKTGQDLVSEFGFRGVEFGNWVTGAERQNHVNWAYDALMDLASVLKVKPKDLSFGGTLGLAFGSRGKGRHSAHYESDTHVINITKTRGDGSLSHEWSHALDYSLRDQAKTYAGQDIGRSASRVLKDTKRFLTSRLSLESTLSRLDALLSGQSWIQGQKSLGPLKTAQEYLSMRYWSRNNWGSMLATQYLKSSTRIGTYWSKNEELWARSFEAWALDTLGQSQYLVNSWAQEGQITKAHGYKGTPFPEGEERIEFNRMWGDLVKALEWTNEGPRISKEYVSEWSKQVKTVNDALSEIDLEARSAERMSGLPSADGLWWYQSFGKRAPGNQPEGYAAFDDKAKAGYTLVGYGEALQGGVAQRFRLTPMKMEATESTVYLKGEKDAEQLGDRSEEALDRIQTEVREISEGEGRAARGAPEGRGKRQTDVRVTREEGGEPLGGAARGEDLLSTPSGRGERTAAGTRSSSVRATPYRITDSDRSPGGSAGKFGANLAAIRTLKALQSEGRQATPQEQAILVQYSGWGGLKKAFDSWTEWSRTLQEVLTPEEYRQAKSSLLNAHYTSFPVIRAMWSAAKRLGFEQGRILEPASGIGHFIGLIPDSLSPGSRFTAVEIDGISAAITGQLYPQASVHHSPFQEVRLPANFYDLVITNVPFLEVPPFDKTYNPKRSLLLHDYYLKKSIALTRPGGLVAAITSKGTMDKRSEHARNAISEDADLIAAIRLPEDAFLKNAGTTVTTDILFFRRKVQGEAFQGAAWLQAEEQAFPQKDFPEQEAVKLPINEYYVKNPEMMLGAMKARSGRYGNRMESALVPTGEDVLPQLLGRAVEELPAGVIPDAVSLPDIKPLGSIPAEGEVLDGGFTIQEGRLYQRVGSRFNPIPETSPKERSDGVKIRKFIHLRSAFKNLMRLQMERGEDQAIRKARRELNGLYDSYVKQHGFLNATLERTEFGRDPNAPSLLALEIWDEDTKTATKAGIFKRNTIEPRVSPTSADNPQDALAISLNEEGRVNLDRIARLTGSTAREVSENLRGSIIDDPERGWVTMDAYLSGNVREKLRVATAAAQSDPKYQENTRALNSIQPVDVTAAEVTASIGSPWIPPSDVALFLSELIGFPVADIEVHYLDSLGQFNFEFKTRPAEAAARRAVAARNDWGTTRKNFFDLMTLALKGGFPKVYDEDPVTEKKYINRPETEAAKDKLRKIKTRFQEWVWEDKERATRLLRIYNDRMNAIRLRTYEGSHLRFPLMNVEIELNAHQKNAVWRILQSAGTYLGHEVGTGKSFILIAAAMKARQMGLARKPVLAVPKPLLGQFTKDSSLLYPSAKTLTVHISTGSSPSSGLQKRRAIAQIANNDWDAVILSHGSFNSIGVSKEQQLSTRQEELDEVETALAAVGDRRTRLRRSLETKLVSLTEKFRSLESKIKREKFLTFEETGLDVVLIDEAHEYKNLAFTTQFGRTVRGLNPAGSGRAFELYSKTRHLHRTNGKIVLASGTPLTNSIGELFTISRYTQPGELEARNIKQFDRWASIFGEVDEVMEYKPEGGGFRPVTKMNFQNMPELLQMVYLALDVVTADKVGIHRPPIKGGKPIPVVLDQSEEQARYQKELEGRARDVRNDPIGMLPDNMLAVVMDGRKAAIDMRFLGPEYPANPEGKIAEVGRRVKEVYDRTNHFKGTQLVFLDLTRTRGDGWSFNAQTAVRESLLRAGIPENQIAIYHEVEGASRTAKARMAKLFKEINEGKVRVLIASTSKGGTGLNVQALGAAIHHLDINWTVAKYLQRTGRFFRQGNRVYIDHGHELEVYNYATEATVETFMWDKVASKERLFQRILSGDMSYRTAEDISKNDITSAEMVALTSGDPLVMEREDLFQRVSRLQDLRQAWTMQIWDLKQQLAVMPRQIESTKALIESYRESLSLANEMESIHFDTPDLRTGDLTSYSFPLAEEDKKKAKQLAQAWGRHLEALEQTTNGDDARIAIFRGPLGDIPLEAKYRYRITKEGRPGDWEMSELGLQFPSFRSRHDPGANPRALVKTASKRLERMMEDAENQVAEMENTSLPNLKEAVKKPFEFAEEFDRKTKRLEEIDLSFKQQDKPEDQEKTTGETTTTAEQVNQEADRESSGRPPRTAGSASTPPAPPSKRRGGSPGPPSGPPSGDEGAFEFTPEAERRFQEGQKGQKTADEPLLTRIWDWLKTQTQGFVREYVDLPETPRFADAKAKLRKLKAASSVTSGEILDHIRRLAGGLDSRELLVLTRKSVMDDLYEDVRRGLEIPIFLEGTENFIENYRRLNLEMAKHPELLRRIRARRAFNNKIKLRLYNAGLIDKESLTRKNYFTHRVLEYAHDSMMAWKKGPRSGLKKPRWFHREGTQLLINTNLIEAESQYLQKALMDLAEVEAINYFDGSDYNLRQELKTEIRAHNLGETTALAIQEAQSILKGSPSTASLAEPLGEVRSLAGMRQFIEDRIELIKDTKFPIYEQMDTFRKGIGRGFGQLKESLSPDDVPDGYMEQYEALMSSEKGAVGEDSVFPLITWVVQNVQGEASTAASIILGNINARRSFQRDLLGKKFLNSNNMDQAIQQLRRKAPESRWADYTAWQPKKGRMFFTALTLPQRILDRLNDNLRQILSETEGLVGFFDAHEIQHALDTMRPQLVLGGPNYELVIPNELAATLDSFGQDEFQNAILRDVDKATRAWKSWALINPLSYFKYNTQNLSGDLDIVLAAFPKSLRPSEKVLQDSWNEIWDVMVKKGKPSASYKRGAEQGVFDSGWSLAEVYTLEEDFQDLVPSGFGVQAIRKVWKTLSRSTTMRENWLRYALFLHVEKGIKAVKAAPGGRQRLAREFMPLIGYGAGRPEIADAISEDADRAGYLARETMGDYGAISHHGNLLRRTIYPFWSFQEINLRRYYRIAKNIKETAKGTERNRQLAKLGAKVGVRAALWMTMRVFLWKMGVWLWNNWRNDDLEEELRDEQRRRGNAIIGKVGSRVISVRVPGSLSDLMGWFGVDDVRAALEHVEKGRGTFGDVVAAVSSAPIDKFVNGLHPIMKLPFETLLGVTFFPTPTNPRTAVDPWRTWPQAIKLEYFYDYLLGRPSLGLGHQLLKVFTDVQDTQSSAYYKIRGEAYQWKRSIKGETGGPRYMGDRAVAYHYYRQALRFEDREAARFWRRRLFRELRVKPSDLKAMLERAHPLGMLSKRDRLDFRKTLTPAERRSYQRAVRYWRERYLRP